MTLSEKLYKLRRSSGLSQEELAEKLGVSRQAISKWERGDSSPDISNLISVASLYGISVDELAACIRGDPSILYEEIHTSEGISLNKEDYKQKNCAESSGMAGGFVSMSLPSDSEDDDIFPNREVFPETDSEEIFPHGRTVSFDNSAEFYPEQNNSVKYSSERLSPPPANDTADIPRSRPYDMSYKYDTVSHRLAKSPKKKKLSPQDILSPARYELYNKLMKFPFWALSLMAFLFFGGIFGEWEYSWLFFLTIPLYYTFIKAVMLRNWYLFCYPVLATIGFFLGGWLFGGFYGYEMAAHTIFCFMTIPLYYTSILAYRKRNVKYFCFPVLITMIYLIFGVLSDAFQECLWMFALIPFCYYFSPQLNKIVFKHKP